MNDVTERRVVTLGDSEMRVMREEGQPMRLRGSWAVYDSRSENLGGFVEYIMPGAARDVMEDDVRALFNHDPDNILGRSTNGTLRMWEDERGGYYEVDVDEEDPLAVRVARKVERRDVTGNSFAFSVEEGDDEWEFNQDSDTYTRRIHRLARLYDVGPVTFPAYRATVVSARALDNASRQVGHDVSKYWQRHIDSWKALAPQGI